MGWYGPITTPACTGNDGSGAATVTTADIVRGCCKAIYISYVGDDPASTDVTVKTQGTSPACPSHNLIVATDTATDKLYPMQVISYDEAAADTTHGVPPPVDDYVTVVVAQANTGDIIKVWLYLVN